MGVQHGRGRATVPLTVNVGWGVSHCARQHVRQVPKCPVGCLQTAPSKQQRNMASSDTNNAPSVTIDTAPKECAAGCGFFGNPNTGNMCAVLSRLHSYPFPREWPGVARRCGLRSRCLVLARPHRSHRSNFVGCSPCAHGAFRARTAAGSVGTRWAPSPLGSDHPSIQVLEVLQAHPRPGQGVHAAGGGARRGARCCCAMPAVRQACHRSGAAGPSRRRQGGGDFRSSSSILLRCHGRRCRAAAQTREPEEAGR